MSNVELCKKWRPPVAMPAQVSLRQAGAGDGGGLPRVMTSLPDDSLLKSRFTPGVSSASGASIMRLVHGMSRKTAVTLYLPRCFCVRGPPMRYGVAT